jgi:hypothetical protein
MPGFAAIWRRTSTHHGTRGAAHGAHAERGEQEGQQAADEHADDHFGGP